MFYSFLLYLTDFIGNIISKLVLIIVFFGLFTPISLFLKLIKRDPLKKKINKDVDTYWIERKTLLQSMKKQF